MTISKLEKFSNEAVAHVYGVKVENLNEANFGVDWPNVVKFIETIAQIVMSLMVKCPVKAQLTQSIKSSSWFQRAKFRGLVKEHCDGCDCSKIKASSGKIADTLLSQSAKLTEVEVTEIADEVLLVDNWLL